MTECPHCGGSIKCQVAIIQTYDCTITDNRVKPDYPNPSSIDCTVEQVFCKNCDRVLDIETDELQLDRVIEVSGLFE